MAKKEVCIDITNNITWQDCFFGKYEQISNYDLAKKRF